MPKTKDLQSEDSFQNLYATIECQQPIADLYKFVGRIHINHSGEKATYPLGPENVALRGSRLKETPFFFGREYIFYCPKMAGTIFKSEIKAKNDQKKKNYVYRCERHKTWSLTFDVWLVSIFCLQIKKTDLP